MQRQVLYLGEINDSQRAAWGKTIEVYQDGEANARQMALFPEDRPAPVLDCDVVQIKLSELTLRAPRQWGACWLALALWTQLQLDAFWADKLPQNRQGTRWLHVFKTLVCYRLIDPGSEWRLHRQWYERSAMGDLLGEDFGLVQSDKLYRCLDKLLSHKHAFFSYLKAQWASLFGARFEVLLYDLTSTYFESPLPEEGKRKYGYSRDKRPDCVQGVIALIVTPEGLPLAYEVMPGNTADKTTLEDFLKKIEQQHGKSDRVWIMDRGIPTEETLAVMRASDPPVRYLVGTPKGRLSKLEKRFLDIPWAQARESVDVKLLEERGELYLLARSAGRIDKEQAMRKRRLKKLWKRLYALQQQLTRDELLLKIGAAKKEAGRAYALVTLRLPEKDQPVTPESFTFSLDKKRLRQTRRREGHYLLRSNLTGDNPAQLWEYYLQLTEIEQAFKELKSDLAIRPIYHQKDDRIEAPIFVAFVAYCLQVTLKQRTRALAPGLTPRAVIEKFAGIAMVDIYLPTTDGRQILLSHYTPPEPDQEILLNRLALRLPPQPLPKISPSLTVSRCSYLARCSADLGHPHL